MSGPVDKADIRKPAVSSTEDSAPYVNLTWTNASTVVTASGNTSWPNMALQSNASVTSSILDVPAGSNYVTNVFGNSDIDGMMDLSSLTGTYKCWFYATKIYRDVIITPMTTNERLFQYGDQGSNAGGVGGIVARINNPAKTVTFTAHTPYVTGETGAQNLHDPQATTTTTMDSNVAGTSIFMVIDNSVSPWQARIYIDGVLQVSDECPAHPTDGSRTLPGISTAQADNSQGMSIMSQSDGSTNPLKDSSLYPIWIGKATNTAHAAALAVAHHADPLTNPYPRA